MKHHQIIRISTVATEGVSSSQGSKQNVKIQWQYLRMLQQYSAYNFVSDNRNYHTKKELQIYKTNITHKLLANYLFKTDSLEESPILTDILMDQKKLETFLPCTNTEKPVKMVVLLRQNIK